MDRDLKLNSIDRYVKSSPRFVLEEHGHCEVPAGCGGVVLRWRDPRTSVPVLLNMALIGAAERSMLIDGASPASSRPLLVPGKHVFTIHAVAEAAATVLVLFSARADYPPNDPWLLLSGSADSWRWTDEQPPDSWSEPAFDDSAWQPLVTGELTPEQADGYAVRRLRESGAQPLTTAARVPRLWIRATFDVPAVSAEAE